ncbi:retrovirus-related pol polyprotein from transposon TNT 1-94 [Tanacetum coccineum]
MVQNVQGRQNKGQGNNPLGGGATGYGGAQNRVGNTNPGQARQIKCYNYNGIGHIARNCTQPKHPQNSDNFKDKMLLMQAQENGVALDEEQLLFLAGGQDDTIIEDVDEQPVHDLALNVDNVFQVNDCDAFDSDVDERPPEQQTMFMANSIIDVVCEHHEEHEMHDDIQPNYVVDSHADYTSDSNMIPYDQYVKDNAVPVVQGNVSSVPNDAYMMIYNDMYEPHAQSVSKTTRNTVVDNSLTAELATYKEQVKLYERRARFELMEREQKIDEQLRIVITDRNIKEENLKKELHSSDQSTSTAAPSSSKTTASAEYTAWTTTDTRLKPSVSSIPEDLHMDDDTAPDEQVHSSGDEDIGHDHIPTVNLKQNWWKPLTEDRPATPEPAWSIPSSDLPVPMNNWASALASTYAPPPENSLLAQTGDMAIFMDWFCKKQGITELKQQDLEGPAYEIVKVFHPNVIHLQSSDHLPPQDKKILSTAVNLWIRNLVIRQRVEDFQLGIESYQTQLNLTKPRWDATGFEFKHDFTTEMELVLEHTQQGSSNEVSWVSNSLVHSLRALSTLRRSSLRTASTAAKPCQGDSLEFYLITGSIYTD